MNELELTLAAELVEISRRFRVKFSRQKILEILREEWPNLSGKTAQNIASSAIRITEAADFLSRRFPEGILSQKICEFSESPFETEILKAAADILNRERSEKTESEKILAFPKLWTRFAQRTKKPP